MQRINGIEGARAVKVHASQMGNGGEPDVDACVRGRSVKVEVKQPGKVPTPRQMAVLRKWERAGALAGWVTSVEELDALLAHLDDPDWRNPQLARDV
jgi:hypothetical protein